jgi:HTTM domain
VSTTVPESSSRPAPWWGRAWSWWLAPLPRARIAFLRIAVYVFVWFDVLLIRPWVADHGTVPTDLYQPLFIGRILPLPAPVPWFARAVEVALLTSAAVAAWGRLPRLAGAATFALYLEWMLIAFSYGKVDHDRFAFLVALAVLPTVGKASLTDERADSVSGWAVHSIQVAVVATYFLAAFAKLRYGGLGWVLGATLTRAVLRRGTFLADPLLDHPWVLRAGQFGIILFELASPLLLVPGRVGYVFVGLAVVFHIVTYAAITIIFHPHALCLLSFLPLERLARRRAAAKHPAPVIRS